MVTSDRVGGNLVSELGIHASARENFDRRAAALRESLASLVRTGGQVSPADSWLNEIHVPTTVRADQVIGPIRTGTRGDRPSIVESSTTGHRGLTGESAAEFYKLCESVASAIQPAGCVGPGALESVATDWLFSKESTSFCEHCLQQLGPKIRRYEVWVPVADLTIEEEIPIGEVTLRQVTPQRIDTWYSAPTDRELTEEEAQHVTGYREKRRKELQGYAAGVIEIVAEPEHAKHVALEAVDTALAMFRFAAFSVGGRPSRCVPRGKERRDEYIVVLECEGTFGGESRGAYDPLDVQRWAVSAKEIGEIRQCSLDDISVLLQTSKRSTFQERLLGSMRLFGDAALERRIEIRLILLLSALESVFIKNRSEPLQQNLGERLSFVTEDHVDGRKRVVKLVRTIYDLRSGFVHHGGTINSDVQDTLREFYLKAWLGLLAALNSADDYSTVEEFTEVIDTRKLS